MVWVKLLTVQSVRQNIAQEIMGGITQMADFCKECSIKVFGEDFGDLANLGNGEKLKEGHGWEALCEGCGIILVDDDGKRIWKKKEK